MMAGDAYSKDLQRQRRAEPSGDLPADIRLRQRQGKDITDLFFQAVDYATLLPADAGRSFMEELRRSFKEENMFYYKQATAVCTDNFSNDLAALNSMCKYLPSVARRFVFQYTPRNRDDERLEQVQIYWAAEGPQFAACSTYSNDIHKIVTVQIPSEHAPEFQERIKVLEEETPFTLKLEPTPPNTESYTFVKIIS